MWPVPATSFTAADAAPTLPESEVSTVRSRVRLFPRHLTGARSRTKHRTRVATLVAALALGGTVAVSLPAAAVDPAPSDSVDPLIGSSGGGNTFPGAMAPFGMMSWSPTSTRGDQTNTGAANGYDYNTTRLRGFALTHVNGAGCHPGAAGDVPIFPHTAAVTSSPTADTTDAIYASDFSHANESATPGRYKLALANGARPTSPRPRGRRSAPSASPRASPRTCCSALRTRSMAARTPRPTSTWRTSGSRGRC
jgi:hypothetical protein